MVLWSLVWVGGGSRIMHENLARCPLQTASARFLAGRMQGGYDCWRFPFLGPKVAIVLLGATKPSLEVGLLVASRPKAKAFGHPSKEADSRCLSAVFGDATRSPFPRRQSNSKTAVLFFLLLL